jgi:mannose-6-phosphate isomerase-like protein (cupin superfamily)
METFESFRARKLAAGADEVVERKWDANQIVDQHAHPFDADALVSEGEMWLVVEDREQHLLPGDTFQLPHGQKHSERYGPRGATYWVARTNRR